MRHKYAKRIMIAGSVLFFLGLFNLSFCAGAAEKGQILFQDNFTSTKATNWIPYVPGKLRKCTLKKVWVPNIGNGQSAVRVMITGFSGQWCGIRCPAFKIYGPGNIKVSFNVYSRFKTTAKVELGTRGPKKWLFNKGFQMGPQWKTVTCEAILDENAAEKGFIGMRFCFSNNTDASITDVKVSYSK